MIIPPNPPLEKSVRLETEGGWGDLKPTTDVTFSVDTLSFISASFKRAKYPFGEARPD